MKQYQYLIGIFSFPLLLILFANTSCHHQHKNVEMYSVENNFIPSGYMGDGEYGRRYIDFDAAYKLDPHTNPTCTKIRYTFGPQYWAGIYWQNKPGNWGDRNGEDFSEIGFTRIAFWAKGETGSEIIEFKAGGIENPKKEFKDSFEKSIGRIRLTQEWREYEINIKGLDLSSVIGGFCWTASKDYNNQPSITFYVDDICFK
jgi:hypothetical protein